MATAEVRNYGVQITIGLTDDEARILKSMMQNSFPGEGEIAEGVRLVIFDSLHQAGVETL
jgi:hypothetical protein